MATTASPVVKTSAGDVSGRFADGVYAFRDIPYGAPTGGQSRFLPPRRVEPWPGTREAVEYGSASPQPLYPLAQGYLVAPQHQGEDCLALNVWTRQLGDSDRRPVVVWLHGGSYTLGSPEMAGDGAGLAAEGVVVVAPGARLGAVGFLYLAQLFGTEYADSGNAGLLDLVLALEWVRDNIEAFGGDPNNITLLGESGTGNRVLALLATPSSHGLIHRGIAMSGPLPRGVEPARATELAQRIMRQLGITTLSELQETPFRKLLDAQAAVLGGPTGGPRVGIGPVVDGRSFPAHPFDPQMADSVADVPVIVGCNRDEGTMVLHQVADHSRAAVSAWVDARLKPITGAETSRIVDFYCQGDTDSDYLEAVIAARSDLMRIPMERVAARRSRGGRTPVYFYVFCHPLDERTRAGHAVIPRLLFGHGDGYRSEIGGLVRETWLAFARTGNPNHQGIPAWPAYNEQDRPTMLLDLPSRVENDPGRDARLAWEDLDVTGW